MNTPLTVKELIEKLQKVDNQDAIIAVTSSNFELNGAKLSAKSLYSFKGKIIKENFRDAFDGGSYDKEIIRWDDKENQEFIEIM